MADEALCKTWFVELNKLRVKDLFHPTAEELEQTGEASRSEDLFRPSVDDVREAAEVFRSYGKRLHKPQMDKITEKQLGDSDTLFATVFYTRDSEPINPVMRDLWSKWSKKQLTNFDDRQKFAIAASVLIQSYIMEETWTTKWNLQRMTKENVLAEELMPFRCLTSFAIVEQKDFGNHKLLLRTRVGRFLGHVSCHPEEHEVLLPIGYTGKIIELGDKDVTAHSKHVASGSESSYRNPKSRLYKD